MGRSSRAGACPDPRRSMVVGAGHGAAPDAASDAATALGRGDPIAPLHSSIAEANGIVAALKHASAELGSRADQQRVLMQELSHRVKNIISVVSALASRTLSEEHSLAEARTTLLQRLQSLARAHDLLIGANWGAAPLKALVAAELAPFAKRAVVSGPEVFVEADKVQTFAMMLHELPPMPPSTARCRPNKARSR